MPHLLVIGTGLIGGSFALAARRAGCFDRVTGCDLDAHTRSRALELGIADRVCNAVSAAPPADAILVAVPPSSTASVVAELYERGTVGEAPVFDVASVKASVLSTLRERLQTVPDGFVPCHPLTGSERSGAAAASASLFAGSRVVATPVASTSPAALERVRGWWQACGAEVVLADAEEHDRHVALTSHVPHLLAYAYVAGLADRSHALAGYAGPGFRDFTRIAGSDPQLWREIVQANRGHVAAALDDFLARAGRYLRHIRAGELDTLEREFRIAQAAHRTLSTLASAGVPHEP